MDRPENAEEYFLGKVERLVVVAEQVKRELVNEPLVFVDERGAGVFVARGHLCTSAASPDDVLPGRARIGFTESSSAILPSRSGKPADGR